MSDQQESSCPSLQKLAATVLSSISGANHTNNRAPVTGLEYDSEESMPNLAGQHHHSQKANLLPSERSHRQSTDADGIGTNDIHLCAPLASAVTRPVVVNGEVFILPKQLRPIKALGKGAFGFVIAVQDTKSGQRVAVKKLPGVFRSHTANLSMTSDCTKVIRELVVLRNALHPKLLSCAVITPKMKRSVAGKPSLRRFSPTPVSLSDIHSRVTQPPPWMCPPSKSPPYFTDCWWSQEDGAVYMCSALMPSTLDRILLSETRLRDNHIRWVLYQLCCGLKYLHSAGIVHRDLKPANVLISSNCSVKICDYGCARDLSSNSCDAPILADPADDDAAGSDSAEAGAGSGDSFCAGDNVDEGARDSDSSYTGYKEEEEEERQGVEEGGGGGGGGGGRLMSMEVTTLWYRAPEVLLGCADYGTAVDMWALGCVAVEMVHRRALFQGESEDGQLRNILAVLGSPPPMASPPPRPSSSSSRRSDSYYGEGGHGEGGGGGGERKQQQQHSEEGNGGGGGDENEAGRFQYTPPFLRAHPQSLQLLQSQPRCAGKDWRKMLAGHDPNLVDLVSRLLAFDPTQRLTAAEAVAHPYFADIRDPSAEVESAAAITMPSSMEHPPPSWDESQRQVHLERLLLEEMGRRAPLA